MMAVPSKQTAHTSHSKNNQNNTPDILIAKIDRLLQDTKATTLNQNDKAIVAHRQERYLVALVLLTRVSVDEDVDDDEINDNAKELIQKLWSNHQEKLVQFAVRLLHREDDSLPTDAADTVVLRVYGRLVANLALKIPKLYQTSLDALGKSLLGVLSTLNQEQSTQSLLAGVETIQALDRISADVWNSKEHRADLEHALDTVVTRCHDLLSASAATSPALDDDANSKSLDHDTNMMIQTLNALLPGQLVHEDDKTKRNVWDEWGRVTAMFVQRHAHEHIRYLGKKAGVPNYYSTLVTMICGNASPVNQKGSNNKVSLDAQHAWYEVLLQCTQILADRPTFQQYLLKKNATDQSMLLSRLLLALVSSPSSSADRLRSQAWMTMAVLVETMGFDWTVSAKSAVTSLRDASSSSSSSKVPTWSTLVRLGSAEWRIQLSRHSTEALDRADPDQSQQTEPSDSPTIDLIESCGRFLLATLAWAGKLADDDESGNGSSVNVPLSSDALLALRQALDDAANVVVRFLTLPERQFAQCDAHIQSIAGRVLGGLLTELDVWEDFPRCGVSTRQVLQAVHVATSISNSKDQSLAPFLIPALLILYQTAEDDDARLVLLRRSGLLNDKSIVPLVSNVFDGVADPESIGLIPSTCQLVELWLSLVQRPKDATQLKRAVLRWIQQALDARGSSKLITEALSSAVGCFITLQGDTVPGDEESRVIEHALQRVGHSW